MCLWQVINANVKIVKKLKKIVCVNVVSTDI